MKLNHKQQVNNKDKDSDDDSKTSEKDDV